MLPQKRGIRGPTTIWIVQRTQATGDRHPTPSAMAFLHPRRASTSRHVSDVPLYIHLGIERSTHLWQLHISHLVVNLPNCRASPPSRAHRPGPEPFL